MPSCTSPLIGYQMRGDVNPATGKLRVHLRRHGQRLSVTTRHTDVREIELPCGKCMGCRLLKRAEWSVRMYHEASQHAQNSFLTLTYDDAHLPPHLEQPELSKFFRKLRDTNVKLRYFACGEYGSQTRRPHYHAVVFGQDFLGGAEQIGENQYFNPVLNAMWGKGHVQVGSFTMGAACYVAGYVSKKMGDTNDDSFQVMSRRPGIGHDWLDSFGDDIRRLGYVVIDGKKFPIPKRYLAWKETEWSDLIADRKQHVENFTDEERKRRDSARPSREVNYKARSKPKEQGKL